MKIVRSYFDFFAIKFKFRPFFIFAVVFRDLRRIIRTPHSDFHCWNFRAGNPWEAYHRLYLFGMCWGYFWVP